MEPARIAADQLARMRGMTRYYHERFFSDVRFSVAASLTLLVAGWWRVPEAFLLVPVVALLGAVMTAFDASYLIFARHYSARLERWLGRETGTGVLVAADLESTYLFPLDRPKVVVAALGGGFTWFGFVTLFLAAIGAVTFGFGMVLAWPVLEGHGTGWLAAYVAVIGSALAAAAAAGVWWFVLGVGEHRLREVLDRQFD